MYSLREYENLLQTARNAALNAYAPYSQFRVGAALLCKDGTLVTGSNVENRSYGLTICAERVAIGSAISQGKHEFAALAIFCLDAGYPVSPCGACRQVISEFVSGEFPIIFSGFKGDIVQTTLGEIFPFDALHELKKTDQ